MSGQFPEENNETGTLLGEGEAALWLSESLILALVEDILLNTATILEAIDIIIAAKSQSQRRLSSRSVTRGGDALSIDQCQHRRREACSDRRKAPSASAVEILDLVAPVIDSAVFV
jgi:hypothetical protein